MVAFKAFASKVWSLVKKTPAAVIGLIIALASIIVWLHRRRAVELKLQEVLKEQSNLEVEHNRKMRQLEGSTDRARRREITRFKSEKIKILNKSDALNKALDEGAGGIADAWNTRLFGMKE